jgi:hypothetical protein
MPKKRTLEESLHLSKRKRPGKFSKPSTRNFILEWMDKVINFHFGTDKIDLKNVYDWEVKRISKEVGFGWDAQKLDWEIILKAKKGMLYLDWKIMGPDCDKNNNDVFHTWLYWIMVSLIEHSKCKITEKQEGMLKKDRRKKKIRGRRDKREFDVRHETFISLLDDIEKKAEKLHKQKKTAFKGEGGMQIKEFELTWDKKIGGTPKASVYSAAWEKTKKEKLPIAVKVIDCKDSDEVKKFVNEARIMAAAGAHPNIIRLIDAKAFKRILTVYMEKGDQALLQAAEGLKKYERIGIADGILNGVSHLHSRGIYHLDLKPENIVIVDSEQWGKVAKIIDFGTARNKAAFRKRNDLYKCEDGWEWVGTQGYIPPESWGKEESIFSKREEYQPSESKHLEKRDAYAIGVTFMFSLIGPLCSKDLDPPYWYEGGKRNVNYKNDRRTVMRYLNKVESRLQRSKNKLETEGLYGLAALAMEMINTNVDERITVKEAKEKFPNMMKTMRLIKPLPKKYISIDKL